MTPWSHELPRILLVALGVVFAWVVFGHLFLWTTVGLAYYLAHHVTNITRLFNWVTRRPEENPPQSRGVWEELFNALYRHNKQHRAEVKRRERQLERFQESTTALPDATIILTKHGNIEWINERSKEFLGLKERDIGQRIENLIRIPRFVEYLQAGDYAEPLEMPSPRFPSNTLLVRIVPYGRSRRLLVARDMTRLQRMERMRRDFIANFSHELRTPLTVLRGYLETMDGDPALAGEWETAIKNMHQQVRRMEHINDDLLFLSRLESPDNPRKDEEVDIAALLTGIREDALALAQGRLTIGLDCDHGVNLSGSLNELRSAFSNLVFNAVRYTPAGGEVSLRWYRDDNGAHFVVKDTGTGIAPHHIPRLTERFYRVDAGRSRENGGTGLGLAIVKHVMNRHLGSLEIQSTLGLGSTFTCHFPDKLIVARAALS